MAEGVHVFDNAVVDTEAEGLNVEHKKKQLDLG